MSERRGVTQLACSNPSIRLTPLPTSTGNTLQPFPQIRGGHRINVDADILSEETRKGLQTSAFEIVVNVFRRSNHQGKTCDEAYRSLGVAVYKSCHVVELGLSKQQHVAARGEKRIDATKQVGNFRRWFVRRERSNCQAKKTSGDQVCFAKFLLKLLNTRSQQPRVNLRVNCIRVAKISRCKHDGLLIEDFRRGNGRALGGEKYRFCESGTHQVDQQGTAIPILECRPAKIYVVDLDALRDNVLRQAFQKRFLGLHFIER